jgi:hypothetical protein
MVVATRSTKYQDQEQQRRTISSLHLNYFIANLRRRMELITPHLTQRKLTYVQSTVEKFMRHV